MNLINKFIAGVILLLVLFVFLDAVAFSSQKPVKPLGQRRKRLALVALGIGLFTFFGTLVDIDPAVMGSSRWSALGIAQQVWAGNFSPPEGGGFGIVLIDLALAYLVMLAALIALAFSPSQRALKTIGMIGCFLSIEALGWGEQSFKMMFFGLATTHGRAAVNYGPAMYVLPIVMSGLLLISMCDFLDL